MDHINSGNSFGVFDLTEIFESIKFRFINIIFLRKNPRTLRYYIIRCSYNCRVNDKMSIFIYENLMQDILHLNYVRTWKIWTKIEFENINLYFPAF